MHVPLVVQVAAPDIGLRGGAGRPRRHRRSLVAVSVFCGGHRRRLRREVAVAHRAVDLHPRRDLVDVGDEPEHVEQHLLGVARITVGGTSALGLAVVGRGQQLELLDGLAAHGDGAQRQRERCGIGGAPAVQIRAPVERGEHRGDALGMRLGALGAGDVGGGPGEAGGPSPRPPDGPRSRRTRRRAPAGRGARRGRRARRRLGCRPARNPPGAARPGGTPGGRARRRRTRRPPAARPPPGRRATCRPDGAPTTPDDRRPRSARAARGAPRRTSPQRAGRPRTPRSRRGHGAVTAGRRRRRRRPPAARRRRR